MLSHSYFEDGFLDSVYVCRIQKPIKEMNWKQPGQSVNGEDCVTCITQGDR